MFQRFSMKRMAAFRQWTRKPYAVFNSLKLVVKISVMSVAYTIINPTVEANAQADSTQAGTNYELDEVEVSGQRAPVTKAQMSHLVTVITKKEVEQAPAQSINDLLRNVPQTDLRQRGPNGIQADLSIQGGNFDQTLILLNGINISDPQTGHLSLTLPVDMESIDRIEVVKGSLSRVYGPNAFSGTVNLVTGQDTNNYARASISGGDFGLFRSSVSVNQRSGFFHNFIATTQGRSNGYMNNTDYTFNNTFYHGQAIFNGQEVGILLGYSSKDFGANNFYSPKYANQYETDDTYFGSLSGKLKAGNVTVSPSAYLRRNYDHYILIRTSPTTYQNFHETNVYGFGANATYESGLGKTSVGIDYRKEEIYSTGLGDSLDTPKRIPGQVATMHYLLGVERSSLNMYLEHNIHVGNFALSAGLLASKMSKPDTFEIYPGIDASYHLTRGVKLYASANRSMRLPTFTDYYYKSATNIGNRNLRPERAWTYEGGVTFSANGINGYLSYFHRDGSDIIDWVRDSVTGPWRTVNYTDLKTDGIEAQVRIYPGQYLSGLAFIHNLTASYSFTDVNKKAGSLESNYALDNLRHKVSVQLNHRIYKGWGASWNYTWQQRNGEFAPWDVQNKIWKAAQSYPAFGLFDGKIYYEYSYVKAYAAASNMLNTTYYDLGDLPQPGRWFSVGVEMKVGW